ncbi:MAG: WxcM-like domain-containing protein, partial [Saprospiraceae bacterium]|nr:WxcM-like domain-containing protein [Saprospiraceae bacterium]MCF8314258.1 WxcM-like domain-containing protein [Saprospiraceae bacterium]MCF8443074.1 WxcM-like domain-containing protein [Saprospiraceae bacterium]
MMKIDGCKLTPLCIVPNEKGDVMHVLKNTDEGFSAFGEAYFSSVKNGETKGWKRHRRMTLNLVVPVGSIRFRLHDDRTDSPTRDQSEEVELSPKNYQRLTVPPGVWLAFEGKSDGLNLLLNIADMPHDPTEIDSAAELQFGDGKDSAELEFG